MILSNRRVQSTSSPRGERMPHRPRTTRMASSRIAQPANGTLCIEAPIQVRKVAHRLHIRLCLGARPAKKTAGRPIAHCIMSA